MILSKRLEKIVDIVPECETILDVGTDHAYIPIKIIKDGIANRAIAGDLRKGPLEVARKNIRENNLSEKIETRLGSGLEVIKEDEIDCIIIAGMGGNLVRDILEDGKKKIKKDTVIIVQPMTYQEIVREWFDLNGYDIYDEFLVEEDRKIYTIICAKVGQNLSKIEDDFYYYIGKKLLEKQDPLCNKYMESLLNKYKLAIKNMEKMKNKESALRKKYMWIIQKLEVELYKNRLKGEDEK